MPLENVEDFYPLAPLQEGLLFHSLSEPDAQMYLNQSLMTLAGDLNVAAFERAWQCVVARHPILRTFFVWDGVKEPVQVVARQVELKLAHFDDRDLSPVAQQEKIEAMRLDDLRQGFNLAKAPLLRLALMQTAEQRHEFFWSFHHILMDGWSMFAVLQEVFALYTAFSAGRELQLQPIRPYRHYIAWLRQQNQQRAEAFWRKTLKGFTAPTPLVVDRFVDHVDGDEFASQWRHLPAELTATMETFCKRHRLTLNTLVQGAWALLLSRYSGESDVVLGAIVSGRPADLAGTEAMVGLFINTLPVRAQISPRETVLDWLRKLQAQQAELREYEFSSLVKVQSWNDAPRGKPLFDSIFMFENYRKETPLEAMGGELEISNVRWFERVNYPLVALAIPGKEFLLRLTYHRRRFEDETIARMLGHWRTLLEGMTANPQRRLAELPITKAAERRQLVVEWNDTKTDYPREQCIQQLFERQVEQTPDAVAASFAGGQLTYRELNRRANQLAHHLRGLGVGPETLVGICTERSLEMVIGLLAILKAGGAYVPLDPNYPKERLAFMLADTKTPILLTQQRLAGALPDLAAQIICLDKLDNSLDADWAAIASANETNPVVETAPENLAYVIYTSGSTGRPKGACVPHRAVVRLVKETNFASLTAEEVLLQFAPVPFDASTLELWGSLLNGGRLAIFPAHTPSLEELSQVLQEEQVTTLWLTAGLFHQMVEKQLDGLKNLRQLLAGGDVLSVAHVKTVLQKLSGCRLINGYGPTENTTFTCCHPITDADKIGAAVSIGRPIANTQVYLLDRAMQPVPIGVPGDLYAGGDGLARDYLNRPELTAERFIPHPLSETPGARLYATGDLAKYSPEGDIDFLGRNDFQVKIRGFRIELGEIETALAQHPAVRDVVVMAREDTPGDKRLIAYVIADPTHAPAISEWRGFLQERLPDYMIPSAFVRLEVFPLNANGKVDRRALPAPDSSRPDLESAFIAPQTPVEQTIAAIWQEVLKINKVGLHDNFFDLGGHSLHLIQAHGKLKAALQKDIAMVDLFKFPNVGALAKYLSQEQPEAASRQTAQAGQDRAELRRAAMQRRREKSQMVEPVEIEN